METYFEWKLSFSKEYFFGKTINFHQDNHFISFSNPDDIKKVFNDPTTNRPNDILCTHEYFGAESYFLTDGEEWSNMRKFFQKGFHTENLQQIVPKIHVGISNLLKKMENLLNSSDPAMMHIEMQRFALDNNGMISFSTCFLFLFLFFG